MELNVLVTTGTGSGMMMSTFERSNDKIRIKLGLRLFTHSGNRS